MDIQLCIPRQSFKRVRALRVRVHEDNLVSIVRATIAKGNKKDWQHIPREFVIIEDDNGGSVGFTCGEIRALMRWLNTAIPTLTPIAKRKIKDWERIRPGRRP